VKASALAAAITLAVLVVIWDAVEFAGGYSVFPLIVPFTLCPASFLLFGLALLATCWAVIAGYKTLSRGHLRYAAIVAIVLCLAWGFSPFFVARRAFLMGFAARLRQSSSPAEIESAARLCLSLMPHGGHAFGPKKIVGPSAGEAEQSERVWIAVSRYGFVHLLDDTCVISVQPPDVSFEWGGALPGHWGVQFLGAPDSSLPAFCIRFSDKIALFRGD